MEVLVRRFRELRHRGSHLFKRWVVDNPADLHDVGRPTFQNACRSSLRAHSRFGYQSSSSSQGTPGSPGSPPYFPAPRFTADLSVLPAENFGTVAAGIVILPLGF